MSSNFFIRKPKGKIKRKVSSKHGDSSKKSKLENRSKANDVKTNNKFANDEISSDDESIKNHTDEESDDNLITAQEKKVQLAKKYLEEIEKEEKDRLETGDVHSSVVSRLRNDLLDQAGKLSIKVADKLSPPDLTSIQTLRCKEHKLSITTVSLAPNDKWFFSASKDATIVKWCLKTKKKLGVIPSKHKEKDFQKKEHAHDSSVLCLAVSFDSKFLASGDESSIIRIWDAETLSHVHSFKGHRGSVTGLAFCSESNSLYSCSKDRSVRLWNLDEMSFVETLFGHQSVVTDIDVLKKDRAVTSGGTDKTLRVWKIQEESQLIYNGHQKSIDRVKRLDQQHFASCGDDGLICVWGMLKKKPLCILSQAHGIDATNDEPNWISSISCIPNSDLLVSGSCDGSLRFWKCEDKFRKVTPLFSVPVSGFVNSMAFSKDENLLIIGVGQEHRLGRWYKQNKAKNSVMCIQLQIT